MCASYSTVVSKCNIVHFTYHNFVPAQLRTTKSLHHLFPYSGYLCVYSQAKCCIASVEQTQVFSCPKKKLLKKSFFTVIWIL